MYLLDRAPDAPLVTSASDLTLASGCEFGFLSVLDRVLGYSSEEVPPDDAMLIRAAGLGDRHERRLLERYRTEFGDALLELERPARDAASIRAAAEETFRALDAGAPVVYQGVFWDDSDPHFPTVGYADFIVRQPDGSVRIVDTKLARRVKVTALMQLAAYHEQLVRLGLAVDDTIELVLGDGRSETAHIDDVAPVFRVRRARMLDIIREHRAEGRAVVWGDPRYAIDARCKYCAGPAERADDLVGVAGMRLTQRSALIDAGIRTVAQLAATPERPTSCTLADATYSRLHLQARLQVSSVGGGVPEYVVVDPAPIASLPEPSAGDIFFDFEGDPMHQEVGPGGSPRWGLDYLFGWVDAAGEFSALWAHSQAEEADALLQFLDYVAERRRQHPDLHIYHYAAYEKTHLLSIASRHGVGEREVDELLRQGVLVDLYPVVSSSLRIGVPSYSIKKLEPLYLGESRTGVTNAADSVEEYVRSRLAAEDGRDEEAAAIRESIARYNADDCRSTLALRDWLRALPKVASARASLARAAATVQSEAEERPAFEPSPLDLQLQALAEDADARGAEDDAQAYRLAAAAIDYHRREAKTFWWEHYARLEQPSSDWEDTRDVFTVEDGEIDVDWMLETSRQRAPRRRIRLRGHWAPGSTASGKVMLLYDEPLPYVSNYRPGRRVAREATILAELDDGEVYIEELRPADSDPWSILPAHLAPSSPPPADNIAARIQEWGARVVAAAPGWPEDAMSALLRRLPPRVPLEPMRGADDGVRAVVTSLTRMPRGTLAVQGPPGTGKTYLAAHVIATLVRDHHWRIGVVAQSHRVVEHVLTAIVRAGLDRDLVAKAPPGQAGAYATEPFTEIPKTGYANYLAARTLTGCVIGGTAWDFTNRGRVGEDQLDLLVVEEAGQFSLANTIGVATSAQRVLLLGDPQQLPQVSQGTHPSPVDASALGHLIGQHHVMPAEYGYFLAESRRMAPDVTAPVSRLAYDGRLRSHTANEARHLDGLSPGIHPTPVEHRGRSTDSPEEADVVATIIREHLGRTWNEGAEASPRDLEQHDFIVVSPYNAQVERIKATLASGGLDGVEVGTVDKFQGREAVIAIVSLAASDAAEIPRGLDFLLSRNRLNVSISRAKWAAFVVYSPGLFDTLPGTAEGVATLSRFITLVKGQS